MSFAVGSLVRARGREWVVLPESDDDLLVLRPLGGTDDEIAGILTAARGGRAGDLRTCPTRRSVGDDRSAPPAPRRAAARLPRRAPARSARFGRIAVEPRPYQLVPLLMALQARPGPAADRRRRRHRQDDRGRADRRELLDQGEVQRLAVLCPPHLAEQWQARAARQVPHRRRARPRRHRRPAGARPAASASRSSSATRHVIVSTDFIKSDRRRDDFVRACPELVIVDEAHTCADASAGRGGRHQRYQLVAALADDAEPPPDPGHRDAAQRQGGRLPLAARLPRPVVRATCPTTSTGDANERERRRLARHLVQRRRADIAHYLRATRRSPTARRREETYALSPEYRRAVRARSSPTPARRSPTRRRRRHRQRVRWWSALGLLRALASSPAAAARRSATAPRPPTPTTVEEADELGRRDGARPRRRRERRGHRRRPRRRRRARTTTPSAPNRRRLLDARPRGRRARGRRRRQAAAGAIELVKRAASTTASTRSSSAASSRPPSTSPRTLRERCRKGVEVAAVTGTLPPAEREAARRRAGRAPSSASSSRPTAFARASTSRSTSTPSSTTTSPGTRPATSSARAASTASARAGGTVRVLTFYGDDNQIDGDRPRRPAPQAQADPQLPRASPSRCRSTRSGHRGDLRGPLPARAAGSDLCRLPASTSSSPRAAMTLQPSGSRSPTARSARAPCSPRRRSRSTRSPASSRPPARRSAPARSSSASPSRLPGPRRRLARPAT